MLPGNISFIGASASNNGLTGKISNATHLHPGGTITVTYNGSVGECFYQTERFWASDDVNVLYPKFKMNEQIALYFLAPLSKKGKGYGYAFKWTKEKMENDSIEMPVDKNGRIDFDYIESRIRELEAYLIAAGFKDCDLSQSERNALQCISAGQKQMRRFKIVDEFTVANSHNILKSDVIFGSGTTPYVTASEGNNSIVSYISYKPDMIEKGNSIMIGGKTLVVTYQPDDFFSNDSHNLVLTINNERGRTESAQLFMVAAMYKSLSPKYSWGDSISKAKIQSDEVYLPVTVDDTIDFEFMDTYVSAIKKQCIAALKQEISQEHKAYEQAVGLSPVGSEAEKEEPKIIVLPDYHEGCVPLYTLRAACGMFDGEGLWEKEGWVDASGNGFTPDPKRHFAIYAKGNSMLDKIKNGDICVFEWYNQKGGSREGDIVLAEFNGFDDESAIKVYHSKKVRHEDGSWEHTKIELEPLNKEYPVIELDENSEYRTVGVLKCVL